MHTFVKTPGRIMPKLMLSTLFVISLIIAGIGCKPTPPKGDSNTSVKKVDPTKMHVNEFEQKLNSTPNAQLVDVRTPEEYQNGHLKGAQNINYQGDSFAEEVNKLDKTKPVFVYCQMGGRSKEACSYMSNQGFTEIYDMDNGFKSWVHYNKPFEK